MSMEEQLLYRTKYIYVQAFVIKRQVPRPICKCDRPLFGAYALLTIHNIRSNARPSFVLVKKILYRLFSG